LAPGHRYRVAVATVFGTVESWNTNREFAVQLHAPTITSPAVNATIPLQLLTIRWNAIAGIFRYRISVRNLTTDRLIVDGNHTNTNSFNVQANQLVAGNRYRVAVAAISGPVTGPWGQREFPVYSIDNGRLRLPGVTFQTQSLGSGLASSRTLASVDRITVHHTASTIQNPTIADVNNWWPSYWTRAGYHFIIRGDGSIWQLVPIHTHSNGSSNPRNYSPAPNARSIHVAFVGNFRAPSLPTQAARNSFGLLCRTLLRSNQLPNINNTTSHIVGHRTWMATECPGIPRETYLSWV